MARRKAKGKRKKAKRCERRIFTFYLFTFTFESGVALARRRRQRPHHLPALPDRRAADGDAAGGWGDGIGAAGGFPARAAHTSAHHADQRPGQLGVRGWGLGVGGLKFSNPQPPTPNP